jgi:hypothetical protein
MYVERNRRIERASDRLFDGVLVSASGVEIVAALVVATVLVLLAQSLSKADPQMVRRRK